ncbi:hypothetical protein IWW57_003041 [Coemansia sp. S610]|nr:hypothetical protein IWW57_003041 [Coemansia sp. S610]
MYSSTPFQYLPLHIVRPIINYVVSGANSCGYKEKLLIPLLWVCHSFRDIVLLRFFYKCKVSLGFFGIDYVKPYITWPSSPLKPVYATYHLAKSLEIELKIRRVCSGDASRVLSAPPFVGVAFPQVSKLSLSPIWESSREVEYEGYEDEENEYSDDDSTSDLACDIEDFVRRIKRMAPAISVISVYSLHLWSSDGESTDDYRLANLYMALFKIGKATVIDDFAGSMCYSTDLGLVRDLVRLNSPLNAHSDQLLLLARHNTPTQYLDLESVQANDLTGLLRDPDSGKYVECSHLHTLKLESTWNSLKSHNVACTRAIVFPHLRRLQIEENYPSGDDVLFRGNAATLEQLDMTLDPGSE